ncbi:MAG: 2-oxoacid:acceptor oxidoreductase subunit alpha, partial [Dehalococcoidia bacterium]
MSEGKTILMAGTDAVAKAAIYAGCRAYLGYPITPSSEIMESLAREMPKAGGVFLQMEDEIASMAAMVGASWAGAKPMTATSGPGFSLMQENLGLATMLELPCVLVNVQRGGPSTGLPTLGAQQDTLQALWGRHGDQTIIVLAPSNLQEMYDFTVRAFNLAERYRVPVILLADGHLGRLRGKVTPRIDLPVEERKPLGQGSHNTPFSTDSDGVPGFAQLGSGAMVHYTGLSHDERGYPTESLEKNEALLRRLRDKVMNHRDEIVEYEQKGLEDASLVLVGYGSAAPSVRWAQAELNRQGLRTGYFIPKTISPFPDEELAESLDKERRALVVELSMGQLSRLVREIVGRRYPLEQVYSIGAPVDPRKVVEVALRQLTGAVSQ